MLATASFLSVCSAGAMRRPERVNYRGEKNSLGARMNVNPQRLTPRSRNSGFHHAAKILFAASPVWAVMPAADRVPVGHVITATHRLLRQRVQCVGPLDGCAIECKLPSLQVSDHQWLC